MNMRPFAGLAIATFLLSACGASPQQPATVPAPAQESPTESATATSEPSPSATPSATPTPDPTPTNGYTPISTASAQPPAPGRLTLNQFHNPSSYWAESTFDVAGKKGLEGFAYPLRCSEQPVSLELRLQNSYQELKFSVGQEDHQKGPADQLVEVQVIANNKPVQSGKVAFNQIQPFEVAVRDVNSLKLTFLVDAAARRSCTESIKVVVFDAQLA